MNGDTVATTRHAYGSESEHFKGTPMTSYVESVLAAGEKIVYRARISRWKFLLYYLVGILALVAGPVALVVTGDRSQTGFILAGITMLAGLLILLSAAIRRATTELVLTNRRIITK